METRQFPFSTAELESWIEPINIIYLWMTLYWFQSPFRMSLRAWVWLYVLESKWFLQQQKIFRYSDRIYLPMNYSFCLYTFWCAQRIHCSSFSFGCLVFFSTSLSNISLNFLLISLPKHMQCMHNNINLMLSACYRKIGYFHSHPTPSFEGRKPKYSKKQ